MHVVKTMEGTEKPLSFFPLHSYQNDLEFYYTAGLTVCWEASGLYFDTEKNIISSVFPLVEIQIFFLML